MKEGGGLQGVSWSTTTLLVEGREGGKGQCWCLLEQCAGSCQFLLLCGAASTNISAATRLRQKVAWVNLAGAPLSSYRFVFMLGPCEGDQSNTSTAVDGTRTFTAFLGHHSCTGLPVTLHSRAVLVAASYCYRYTALSGRIKT